MIRAIFVAVQAGHADVEQGRVGPHLVEGRNGFAAVVNHRDLVPFHLQQHRQALGRIAVVVGDQYSSSQGSLRTRSG